MSENKNRSKKKKNNNDDVVMQREKSHLAEITASRSFLLPAEPDIKQEEVTLLNESTNNPGKNNKDFLLKLDKPWFDTPECTKKVNINFFHYLKTVYENTSKIKYYTYFTIVNIVMIMIFVNWVWLVGYLLQDYSKVKVVQYLLSLLITTGYSTFLFGLHNYFNKTRTTL